MLEVVGGEANVEPFMEGMCLDLSAAMSTLFKHSATSNSALLAFSTSCPFLRCTLSFSLFRCTLLVPGVFSLALLFQGACNTPTILGPNSPKVVAICDTLTPAGAAAIMAAIVLLQRLLFPLCRPLFAALDSDRATLSRCRLKRCTKRSV